MLCQFLMHSNLSENKTSRIQLIADVLITHQKLETVEFFFYKLSTIQECQYCQLSF